MTKQKYHPTFTFYDTESEATEAGKDYTQTATPYQKKRYPATVTSWTSADGSENKFILWTSYRTR